MNRNLALFSTLLLCFILLSGAPATQAQEKDSCSVSLDVTADFVSSFIWRGLVSDMKPNIQPCVTFTACNFEAGFWGTSNLDNTYREVDYWLAYSYKNFTLTLNDYFWTPFFDSVKFFNWNEKTTGHFLEASLEWEGPEKFPIKLLAATFIYGPDKKFTYDAVTNETKGKNQYSTYFEASYLFKLKKTEVNIFVGGTPAEGFYDSNAGIVNLGLTAKKEIPFSEKYSMPLSGSLILNPKANQAYIVLGITI